MTKYLVRKNKEGALVDFCTVEQEYNYSYQVLEELPYKEGFFTETYWDEEEKKLKQKYIEVPKSDVEKLQDELKKTNKALQDLLVSQFQEEEE